MQPLEHYKDHVPKVADSAYVHPKCVVIGDVEIGDESTIWPCVVIRGDDAPIRIGSQTSIQDGSVVHTTRDLSQTTIGDRVTVGHSVILHGCTVEDECLIGMGATILDNAVIGTGSVVGACALVTMNTKIPPGSLVLGSPAKVKRKLTPEEHKNWIEHGWKEYVERGEEYRARDGRG